MRRSVTFVAWIVVALTIVGCSDDPLVGQRIAKAEGQAGGAALPSSTPVARRVLSGVDVETLNGSPSPDGRSWVHPSAGGIAIRDLATGRDRIVVAAPPAEDGNLILPRFSPDGLRIEYWRDVHLQDALHLLIRTVGLDGTGATTLYEYKPERAGAWFPVGWSRDGAYVATIVDRSPASSRVGVVSMRDGRAWILKTFDWRMPANISFSPNGRFLAYNFPPDEKSHES